MGKSEASLAIAAFLATALFIGAYYIGIKGERRSAFNRWRPILHQLAYGEDIYLRHAFPTPPIMALVLYPFALLPGKWGMSAWFIFKVGLTVLVLRWTIEMTKSAHSPRPAWLVLAALALAIRPVAGDLLHGNVNLWVLFCVVWSFRLFRHRKDWQSGVVLALAAASKVTPMLLIGYFAWKRCWIVVAGAAAGLVLWLVVVPSCALGPTRNLTLLQSWAQMIVYPYLVEGQVETEHVNQSLPGLVYRLTTAGTAIEAEGARPAVFINIANLDRHQARVALGVLSFACLSLVLYLCRTSTVDRADRRLFHELSLVLIAMLLLSERSWKHHYVTLVPVYFSLATAAWQLRATEPRRAATLWASILFSALAMSATSKDIVDFCFGDGVSDLAEAYGAYTWAAVALAFGCASILWRPATTQAGPPSADALVLTAKRRDSNRPGT